MSLKQQQLLKYMPDFDSNNTKSLQQKQKPLYQLRNSDEEYQFKPQKRHSLYEQQIDDGKVIIDRMKQQQILDNLQIQEQRRQFVNDERTASKDRLSLRKKERLALQLGSMQDIVLNDEKQVNGVMEMAEELTDQKQTSLMCSKLSEYQMSLPINGRTSFGWNKLNQTSKKYIQSFLTPTVIKQDERGIEQIAKRIEKDKEVFLKKQENLDEIHKHTRSQFLKTHSRNMQFQEKCGLLPNQKPIVIFQSQLNGSSKIKGNNQSSQQDQSIQRFSPLESVKSDRGNINSFPNSQAMLVEFNNNSTIPVSSHSNRLSSSNMSQITKQQIQSDQSSPPSNDDNNIIIQYNNFRNESSKQELNKINFGDELTIESTKKGPKPIQFLQPNGGQISAPNLSKLNSTANSKLFEVTKPQPLLGSLSINQKKRLSIGEDTCTEREFLSSAGSNNTKKAVNFNIEIPDSVKHTQSAHEYDSNQPFVLKNLQDVVKRKYPQLEYKNQSRIDIMSKPKQLIAEPRDYLDRTEYKGLLAAELNSLSFNSDSNFSKAMMAGSALANSQISMMHSVRPSTLSSRMSRITQTSSNTLSFIRPSTTSSNKHSEPHQNVLQNGSQISKRDSEEFYEQPYFTRQEPGQFPQSSTFSSQISSQYPLFRTKKQVKLKDNNESLQNNFKNMLNELEQFDCSHKQKKDHIGFSKMALMQYQQSDQFNKKQQKPS